MSRTKLHFMDLPPELADNVLASIADAPDAKQALGACALVCHTWRQLAYPYLFKTLHLNFSLVDASLIKESGISVRTVEQIVAFFASSSFASSCIRTLHLRQVIQQQAVPADTLRGILEPLQRLQRLSLYNVLLAPSPPGTQPPPTLPCSLDFLEIHTSEMRCGEYLVTFKEIQNITRFFTHVDHLCLSMLPTAEREEGPEDEGSLVLPAARQLTVINPSSLDLLFRALHHMPTNQLRTVNFENLPSRDLEHVGRFLGMVGPTLTSLQLGEVWSRNIHSAGTSPFHHHASFFAQSFSYLYSNLFTGEILSAMHTLNLSACPSLDSFTFSIPFTLAENVKNASSTPITAAHWRLSQHTSHVIREIVSSVVPSWTRSIGFIFRKNAMYERYRARVGNAKGEMDWKSLDEALVARTLMRKDACVRVEVVCDGFASPTMLFGQSAMDASKEVEREALKTHLPGVAARGLLKF